MAQSSKIAEQVLDGKLLPMLLQTKSNGKLPAICFMEPSKATTKSGNKKTILPLDLKVLQKVRKIALSNKKTTLDAVIRALRKQK